MNELLILCTVFALGFFLHELIVFLCAVLRSGSSTPLQSGADAEPDEKWHDGSQVYDAGKVVRFADRQDSFFKIILDFIPCQVFIKDPQDKFKYKIANRNFTGYYQLEEESVVEHPDEDIFDPEVASQLRRHDLEVCAHPGTIFRFDEDISFCRRGHEVFKSLKLCFHTADGHPYMLGICVDVTDLNKLLQTERINAAILSQVVAEPDFQNALVKIAQVLREELKSSRVVFLTYTKENAFRLFHEQCASNIRSIHDDKLDVHERWWNACLPRLKANELILCNDLVQMPEAQELLSVYSVYTHHSLAAVPLFVGDEFLGAMLISFRVPDACQNLDQEMLKSVSNIIALAAIRDRQTHRMRQVEEENQAILDNISIPLWLYDSSGFLIQTNQAADHILGIPDRECAYGCRHLLKCEEKRADCPVRYVLEHKTSKKQRVECIDRHYIVEANPIFDSRTNVFRGVVNSFYEVTEMDEFISSRQTLNDCLTNLIRESDMRLAIQKSIREICEQLHASRCYIVQFDQQGKSYSCFLEYAREKKHLIDNIQNEGFASDVDWEARFEQTPLIAYPTAEALKNDHDLDMYRTRFSLERMQSLYAYRIMFEGKLWGYLTATYEDTPHELRQSELDFIKSITQCIEIMLVREQFQKKILSALAQAEAADRTKSNFLASMSHEIRTPLNAVIGFSELLKGGTLPRETEVDYLDVISDAGNNLLALINDVLDLSKLEAGQMVFTPSEVDFLSVVQEVQHIFVQSANENKSSLHIDFSDDIPNVCIDTLRVRQILFNLIGNAVKFTSHGTICTKVRFEKITPQTGTLQFSVIDTGIGISEQDQAQIFELFFQAKSLPGTQTQNHGTGLGLAICKRMIEKMSGELLLNSIPGKGSEFKVILRDVPWTTHKIENVEIPPTEPPVALSVSKRVLVVDDVAMNLKVMSALLNKLGQHVITSTSADEAWNILQNTPVDVLLTDLWMPGMNGAELTSKIRQSKKFDNLVTVAVTADVQGEKTFDMSAFDFVMTKPVTIDKLQRFIAKISNSVD